jgi:bifunctional non-homologous end joining protein LigD
VPKKLREYERKRDFEETPEPAGDGRRKRAQGNRFVIHEHHARSLHWDLRLERDGVLVSWAVPKGIPPDPKTNHLAVHVEDHPLSYIDFRGEIPEGNYGAGKVLIYDEGTYDEEKFRDDEVMVVFHGKRVRGRYVLFRTKGKNWMIHRMDPPEDTDREPMPKEVVPMLARLSRLPTDEENWGFEIKWDGIRAVAYVEGGRVRLQNRNMRDVTRQYPELRELGRAAGARQIVLDGEIVAFDERGKPSFQRLQQRMHLASESAVRRRMADIPAVYVIFDVLYLDGHSTMKLTYEERRALLDELALAGPSWLAASREQELEGIMAKRLDSTYEPGKRNRCWLKIKNHLRQELVVGGWMPGEGGRSGRIGSLVVGYYDKRGEEAERRGEEQHLIYAGNVGTGFKEADLATLGTLLEPLRRDTSPFQGRQPKKGAVFAEPRLVVEVEFAEWTKSNTIRAPSYKGLRDDKDPRDVVVEKPEPPPKPGQAG